MGVFDREKRRRKGKAELYQYFVKWHYHKVKLMKEKEQIFRKHSNSAAESQEDTTFLRDGT